MENSTENGTKPKAENDEEPVKDLEWGDEEVECGDEEVEYDADTDLPLDELSIAPPSNNVRPAVRLVTDKRALYLSLNAIRFGVFADAVTTTILDPNYAFMALPNSHPDSFPSTAPFGFNSATYFLAMSALLGMAIASVVIGWISDKVGRKPCILACLGVGAIGAVCNYLARHSFWGFSAANFAQGLFAASLPVAMAYVSDVKRTRKAKDAEIGVLVALNMVGTAGGGICAILMEEQGLFTPLFVGAGLNVAATVLLVLFMIEPNKMLFDGSFDPSTEDEDDEDESPKTIDQKLLWNIVSGALFDNIGSAGLLPIAMSPLALTRFYIDFVEEGQEPIMTQSAFKWISVMVALTVIPGAGFSEIAFDKVGPAVGCVAGNFITGVVTIALLYIAYIEPASTGTYAGFIAFLYIGFPFTVLSQLSTGPMLDTIAPKDRRGYVQGLNIAVMSFATAVSPYLLGELADNFGIRTTVWACVGVSFVAAIVNMPLIFAKKLQVRKKKPAYARRLKGEDGELIERALRGEWVPAEELDALNDERMKKGLPFLIIPYNDYHDDKEHLLKMRKQAMRDFIFLRHNMNELLSDPSLESDEGREELLGQLHTSRASPKMRESLAKGLGKWFADYIVASGYWVEDSPIMYKQMIMQAFPPIGRAGEELTTANMEQVGVNYLTVLNKYLEEHDLPSSTKAFARSMVN